MSKHEINNENPVFTLVAAHYCGPWEWNFVKDLLAQRGYDAIAPLLTIEDPDATLDDHAEIVRQAESQRGAAEYIDVGHSFGGDVIYRKLGATSVSKLLFLAAPLRPVLDETKIPRDSVLPNSRTLLYHTWLNAEKHGASEFDPVLIGNAFFNDIENEDLKTWAISQLRPHPHVPEVNNHSAALPDDIDMHYVGFSKDRTFIYDGQRETARLLGIEFTPFRSGHFPMLSKPDQLVDLMIEVANNQVDQKKWKDLAKSED